MSCARTLGERQARVYQHTGEGTQGNRGRRQRKMGRARRDGGRVGEREGGWVGWRAGEGDGGKHGEME